MEPTHSPPFSSWQRPTRDNKIGLALELGIAGGGIQVRRGRQPVAQEVAAELAGGRLPAPMDVDGRVTRRPESGLQVKY